MSYTQIVISEGVTRHPDYRMAAPINFSLAKGETLAIYGPNGGGKSLFVDILTGAHPLLGLGVRYNFGGKHNNRAADNVRLVSFRDVYGGNAPAYYQQRWNQADEQTFPTVGDVLLQAFNAWSGTKAEQFEDMLALLPDAETLRTLGVLEHVEKPINLLSSGELRRMQLARMLMSSPEVLIVDNPYIGLDVSARCMLTSVLELLAQRLTLVLVVSRPDDIPPFVQSTVTVQQKRVGEKQPLVQFMEQQLGDISATFPEMALPWRDEQQPDTTCSNVIDFHNINIRYGARTILSDLNWTVRRGEHWALTGENGSGKSTLLSLVCADNPQGYACNIRLFGHQRGKGESIWDIKRHIGYVSPEIFSTYRKTLPALDIVASGLHDTIGLYKRPTDEERRYCQQWLDVFGVSHLAERNYMTLSMGEQRLVLLIRAFVKCPDLLILDEPFHGLDINNRSRAQRIIDLYMRHKGKTLIMVTHYENELPQCIDHCLVLKKHA